MSCLALLGGCTTLSGDWAGEITCPESAVDIEFTLEADEGSTYTGEGVYGDAGADCEIQFDIEVEAEKMMGEQDLDVTFDNCKYVCGSDSESYECGDDIKAEWDGEDEITWDEDGCEGEVERD